MKIQRVNEMIETKQDFKKTIFFINWDDWSGLYINGDLINQGHSINIYSVFKDLKSAIAFYYIIILERSQKVVII